VTSSWRTMSEMSGPRRTKGETLPAPSHELERLKRETEKHVPVVRHNASPLNVHVVPSRRGNSAHAVVPPPPDGEGDSDELVIEMSGDDEDEPRSRRSRTETLADPMMTEKLAEIARIAPAPPAPTGPNRHVKRR
jgi:hypothetical protein